MDPVRCHKGCSEALILLLNFLFLPFVNSHIRLSSKHHNGEVQRVQYRENADLTDNLGTSGASWMQLGVPIGQHPKETLKVV